MILLLTEIIIIVLGLVCVALGGMSFEDESDRIAAVMFTLGLLFTVVSHLAF